MQVGHKHLATSLTRVIVKFGIDVTLFKSMIEIIYITFKFIKFRISERFPNIIDRFSMMAFGYSDDTTDMKRNVFNCRK
jgi:hypothetical protein